jgi:Transcriptional regulator
VEHAARRRDVADAVIRLVRQRGVDQVTVRSVAVEAGWSTGVLSHYFRDKDALLVAAFERVTERVTRRVTEQLRGDGVPLAVLERVLAEMLPVDATRRDEAVAWFGFVGYALARPALASVQRRAYADWREVVRDILDAARTAGDLGPGLDPVREAVALVGFVDGLALQALCDPEHFPPVRQLAALADKVGGLAGPTARPTARSEAPGSDHDNQTGRTRSGWNGRPPG